MAGATALHLAQQGKRTLLASTNPVHSLSGLLDQNCYGKAVAVAGVPHLWAYELGTKGTIERAKHHTKQQHRALLQSPPLAAQPGRSPGPPPINPPFVAS